jgi:hypothetical protein
VADAAGEGAEGAVGAGVGVGADDEFAGGDKAFLGQENVLDAHAADFPVMGYGVLFGEVAYGFGLFGRFDVFVGGEVVGDEGDFVAVEHRPADFLELDDRRRPGDVVRKDEVEPAFDELAGDDLVEARMAARGFFPSLSCPWVILLLLLSHRRPDGRRWRLLC